MVLVLKVISCAINYNDGLLKEEDLSQAQKNRLPRCPSLIDYFGYCLCCGSHSAGPVYEMKDYLEWTVGDMESYGWIITISHCCYIACSVSSRIMYGVYLYIVPFYSLSRFSEPVYLEWGFWQRLQYLYMSGFTACRKHYFIWSISEASMITSGFDSGWSSSSPSKSLWDHAKNVDILGVELATNVIELPLVWNIQVSTWLRHHIYENLNQKGKKPGFFQLLATQTVSDAWHVLSMHETPAAYRSVYFIGTIFPIVLILGNVIKPAKPVRPSQGAEGRIKVWGRSGGGSGEVYGAYIFDGSCSIF